MQQTMLTEFYATTTIASFSLEEDLGVWLLDYNYRRVHGSLGRTPMQRCAELLEQTPLWDDVAEAFDPVKEIIFVDRLTLRRLARVCSAHVCMDVWRRLPSHTERIASHRFTSRRLSEPARAIRAGPRCLGIEAIWASRQNRQSSCVARSLAPASPAAR